VGAPSFAHFAKGGNLERIRDWLRRTDKSCVGSIGNHVKPPENLAALKRGLAALHFFLAGSR